VTEGLHGITSELQAAGEARYYVIGR
jgi:hypothetical protein